MEDSQLELLAPLHCELVVQILKGACKDAGKPSKGNSKASAKGKRAASPKKQPAKSVKQTDLSKEVASDLEVSLSDAGDQERQATTSVEDVGEMRA